MAYNSDGYIMIDFTEVDFRRTNQTIEGLYKRCVDVIGTNKFILVINANGRTPLPATCSYTNNQYVIDTCIYMFAISSNDNLFIRRNDVPASDIIDDSSISVDKTWSSNKIDTELDGKADTSLLANYQPLLTAVSPVFISADNEISVDLTSVKLKFFTYTGNGIYNNNTIEFPTKPTLVLSIDCYDDSTTPPTVNAIINPINVGNTRYISVGRIRLTGNVAYNSSEITYIDDTHIKLATSTGFPEFNLNIRDMVYNVCYI